MRKYYFLLLLCFFLPRGSTAQNNLPEKTGDKYFDAILSREHSFFERSMFDSALIHSKKALEYAQNLSDKKIKASALFQVGKCLTALNLYDSAKYYLDTALLYVLEIKDDKLLIQCYNSFAVLYNFQSDNTKSIDYLLKCIAIIENSKDETLKPFLPKICSNIGYIFDLDKQYNKSIVYHLKAYQNKHYTDDTLQLVMIYQNLFLAHLNTGKVLVSKQYLDSAAILNNNFQQSIVEVYIKNNYGIYYETIKDNEKSLWYFLSAYQLCNNIQNEYFKPTVGISISKAYLRLGELPAALKFAKEVRTISTQLKNYYDAAEGYKLLAGIEKKQGNYITAFLFLDSANIYTDSLNLQENRKNILLLESRYQAGKKEKEIADLKILNAEKELAAIKRNRLILIGGISAATIMLLLGLMYRSSNSKKILALKEQEIQKEQIKFLERQQQVISLQSMINGQETERSRIAKDLHDGLGGLFSTIKMYFSTLQHEQETLKEDILFAKSYELIDTAAEEVRRIAHNMMPEVLAKLGLIPAVQDMCSNISAGKLVQVKLQCYGMEERLNAATEIMLYRIVQELLNNILKHAQATEAIVQFNRNAERLMVTVEDNGLGFNLQRADDNKHTGLEIIKSRVNYLHGNISIDSQEKVGTTIMMEFLLNEGI